MYLLAMIVAPEVLLTADPHLRRDPYLFKLGIEYS